MSPQNLGKQLQLRRAEIGISDELMLRATGLSQMELHDLESYDDELMSAFSLAHARAIAAILGLELGRLLEDNGFLEVSGIGSSGPTDLRGHIIATAQTSAGLSDCELAEQIGFSVEAIEKCKMFPSYIEALPIRTINEMAKTLKIPARLLLQSN